MSYYNDPIETETYRGFTIDILPDEDPPNPQRDYEPFGVMVCFHGHYDLGAVDHQRPVAANYHTEDYDGWQGLHDAIAADHPGAVILPLSLLDHSGITMQVGSGAFGCDPGGWDSGSVGFIFASESAMRVARGGGTTPISADDRDDATTWLRGAVEEYARYLEGAAVRYLVTAPSGATIASCGGFYDLADVLTEARVDVDGHIDVLSAALDDVRDITKGLALVALGGGAS